MSFVEPMEPRRLLAATINLVGNTLLVRGNEQAGNTIVIESNADGIHLDASVVSTPQGGSPTTLTQQFVIADVLMVKVRGGRVADSISVGTDAHPVSINARVNGVGGADSITTGAGNDRIAAGSGDDLVNAGSGNDFVFGERGNDTLNGNDGNDSLWGGVGEDVINGGAGDDLLGALLGTNVLTGGDGADTFVIKAGKQSQAGDFVDGVDAYKIRGKASTDGSVAPPTA